MFSQSLFLSSEDQTLRCLLLLLLIIIIIIITFSMELVAVLVE